MPVIPDVPLWFWSAWVFALGLCVGSFLNVCIYRMPYELSVIKPSSRCGKCKTPIAWYDNLPVISYLLLKGTCRHCGESFSPRYMLVELLTGVCFVLAFMRFYQNTSPAVTVFFAFVLTAFLIAIAFIDIDHFIIPDEFSISGIFIGLVFSFLNPDFLGYETALESVGFSLLSAVAAGAMLWLVGEAGTRVFKKEALGMGDVKLLAMLGAFMGLRLALLALFFSALSGTVISVLMMLLGKLKTGQHIPYGPYLSVGGFVAFLWGRQILDWYSAFLM